MTRTVRGIIGLCLILGTIVLSWAGIHMAWMRGLYTGKDLGGFGYVLVVGAIIILVYGLVLLVGALIKDNQ